MRGSAGDRDPPEGNGRHSARMGPFGAADAPLPNRTRTRPHRDRSGEAGATVTGWEIPTRAGSAASSSTWTWPA